MRPSSIIILRIEKMISQVAFNAKNIVKKFGPTVALAGVDLTIFKGEVHGLIGENGSGKSTMASIAAGMVAKDSGEMTLLDSPHEPHTIFDAIKSGICMVGQEQNTIDEISVTANIFIGEEKHFASRVTGLINSKTINEAAKSILNALDLRVNCRALAKTLSFEDRKLIELARALYFKPSLLIIDETSTALSKYGREKLYKVMDDMRAERKSVLFISHDVEEVMQHCDRITVLRDGSIISTVSKQEYSLHGIKQLMVGRQIAENFYRSDLEKRLTDDIALQAEHIQHGILRDVSLQLHYGEILGIGGLTNSGMHELGRILFGIDKPDYGRVVTAQGRVITNTNVATKNKMGYISKNRDMEALTQVASIRENLCLPSLSKLRKGLFITKKSETAFANTWAKILNIKMNDVQQRVMYLSGGNKQKVAVTKWIGNDADILVLDCPTRGIDIGVRSDIYKLLADLKARKKALLMISEELPELVGMSDRIIILKNGSIAGEFDRSRDLTENVLINYMI
jgi:ribose transport system ATP-binding protein